MRLLAEPVHQRLPVLDAIALRPQNIHVGSRTQQPVLQILAEAVVDGERNDERSTPAATPTIEMAVMTPITAWRRLARR